MKSRICLCNGTVLRKDLTRFAPVMLITGLFLAMVGWSLSMMYQLEEEIGWAVEPAQGLQMIAAFQGLASAVCLFSGLTRKKECDAMHALPIRRETFFFTHILAALIFFALPFGIVYAFLPGERGWLFQMTVTFCAWLFHFGLAVFSMMLSGRKLAALILFSLIGDLASSIYMMIDALYIPQLPGLYLDTDVLFQLSPTGYMESVDFANESVADCLLHMLPLALGGIGLLAFSFILYRHRRMERAGDFLAVRWMEPVFAWGLGIGVATFLVSIGYLLDISFWVPLIIGLAIGYFAARMLFARSIKVFDKQTLAAFGTLVGVMGASLYIVGMDPLGAVTKVPQPERIASITLEDGNAHGYGGFGGSGGSCVTSDPEELELLRTIHQEIVRQEQLPEPDWMDQEVLTFNNQFYLTYTLTDGSELRRTYWIEEESHLDQIEHLLSQPEHLVGTDQLEALLRNVSNLQAYGLNGGDIHTRRNFFQVFLADCEAGNMYTTDYDEESAWRVSFTVNIDGEAVYRYISVPLAAENTIAWLEDYFL